MNKKLGTGIIILILINTFGINVIASGGNNPSINELNNKTIRSTTTDIMIFAPHPDDEALGCTGIIYDAVQKGKSIKIVLMTNGDGYRLATEAYYGALKKGDEYWYTQGSTNLASRYDNGILLSPGAYNIGGGGAVYLFDNIPQMNDFRLSLKHFESGWGWHDLGIWAWNYNSNNWDKIDETQIDGEEIWSQIIDGTKYISSSGNVEIFLGADAWDESDIAWVKISKNLDPDQTGTASYYINFGKIRQDETRLAMSSLGLANNDIITLGYPDGGLDDLWTVNRKLTDGKYTSSFTDYDQSPYIDSGYQDYHNTKYGSHAQYYGDALISDIVDILNDYNPKTIYVTHYEDTHGDHKSTNYFVEEAVKQYGNYIDKYYYLVHYQNPPYGGYGNEWPLPSWDEFKEPTNDFQRFNFEIIPDEAYSGYTDQVDSNSYPYFRDFKLNIIEKYSSQRFDNCDIIYLDSFAKNNEIFWRRNFDPTIDGFGFEYFSSSHCTLPILSKVIQDTNVDPTIVNQGAGIRELFAYLEYTYLSEWHKSGYCDAFSFLAKEFYLHPDQIPGGKNVVDLQATDPAVISKFCNKQTEAATDLNHILKYIYVYLGKVSIQDEIVRIKESLNNNIPIVILLNDPTHLPWEGSHAVLAYDYYVNPISNDIDIFVYDNNFKKQKSILSIDMNTWSFIGYDKNSIYSTWTPSITFTNFGAYDESFAIKKITEFFIKNSIWLAIKCPADLHAYDKYNRHVGLNPTGGIDGQIPTTYYSGPGSDPELIIIFAPNYPINIKIKGNGTGLISFKLAEFFTTNYTINYYDNILVNSGTIAYLNISYPNANYSMNINGQVRFPNNTISSSINITQLPIADAGPNQIVVEGETVNFDGTNSQAPVGQIISYEWDFDGDGSTDATGATVSFTWYDDIIATVTLTITTLEIIPTTDDQGNTVYVYVYHTAIDTTTVTVVNVEPTATINAAYMYVDFTLRGAGEKWHNMYLDLFEADWDYDGGPLTEDKLIAHLEIERKPGNPDEQSDTIYDVYIDMEKIYYIVATFDPYEDDKPINGQLWGSNPIWLDLTFEDGSTERLHHNFNVQQSIVRDSEHWIHVLPWEVDLSPWFVDHIVTFEASTTDPGTDDVTFIWDWGDGTQNTIRTYFWDGNHHDDFPSPYDVNEGNYPVNIIRAKFYHIYKYEDDFVVTLTIEDDDKGMNGDTLEIDSIHTQHIYPVK